MRRLLIMSILLSGCGYGISAVPVEDGTVLEVSSESPECLNVRGYDRRLGSDGYAWIETYCKETP